MSCYKFTFQGLQSSSLEKHKEESDKDKFAGIPPPTRHIHLVTPLSVSHLTTPISSTGINALNRGWICKTSPQSERPSLRLNTSGLYINNILHKTAERLHCSRNIMASSELCRILNNANANLYPSEPQPNLLSMTLPVVRPPQLSEIIFNNNNNTMAGPWHQVNPQSWSRQNVLEWIGYHVEESRFDASLLNMSCCEMDGATLCTISRESMMNLFGAVFGDKLYHSLENLKARYDLPDNSVLSESEFDLLDTLLLPFMSEPGLGSLLETVVVQPTDRSDADYGYFSEYRNRLTPESDHGYDSLSESLQSSHNGSLMNPSSPECSGSDSDPEYSEKPSFISTKISVKQEPTEVKKRGRGRPPKQSRGFNLFIESKKSKHAPRGTHLWEFIRDILIHPEQNQGLMKWEDRRDGVFKFLKSEAVAQLWGQKKKNSSMTYEKLSRAMRYYYKRDILERVDGRRLVYKFGKNSTGWRIEETGY